MLEPLRKPLIEITGVPKQQNADVESAVEQLEAQLGEADRGANELEDEIEEQSEELSSIGCPLILGLASAMTGIAMVVFLPNYRACGSWMAAMGASLVLKSCASENYPCLKTIFKAASFFSGLGIAESLVLSVLDAQNSMSHGSESMSSLNFGQ